MSEPGKLNDGRLTEYGLGLTIADHKGHQEIGHSGATEGFKAHMGIFPEDDLAVVILANAADVYSRPVSREIADIYLKAMSKIATPQSIVQAAKPVDQAPFDKMNVDLAKYTGTFYSDELETAYKIELVNGKLLAQHSFLSDIQFSPENRDVFIMDGWMDGKIEFTRDNQQRIKGCKFSFNRMRNLYFRKVNKM